MEKNMTGFLLELGRLMAAHSVSRGELNQLMRSMYNGQPVAVQELVERAEASEIEQQMTQKVRPRIARRIAGSRVNFIEAPVESKEPIELFDGLSGDVPKDLPGLEGTIKPTVRVKRDTLINRVRLWVLSLPKGQLITSAETKQKFGITDGTACTIMSSLLQDRAIRRKRDINGDFIRGVFVKMGKSGESTLKRRLRGKLPK